MSTTSPSSPLVSVIIPVYNTERYLEEALQSVRAQTFRDFEILVVDDGSTDETARVARRGCDVRYFGQERGGAGSARNAGVEAARGEFVAFLDAADRWALNKLALQMDFLRSLPQSDVPTLVFGRARQFFSPDLEEKSRASVRLPELAQPAFLASSLLISRADFYKVGPYKSGIGVDIDWYLGARDGGARVRVLPETLFYRRVHDANTGHVHSGRNSQLVRAVKASLDRRRQATQNGAALCGGLEENSINAYDH